MRNDKSKQKAIYDIAIIGGGPAGLTAGLYAARARMNTLLVESLAVMGQATMTDMVENYPGINQISGFELVDTFKKQAETFGLKSIQETITNISRSRKECENMPIWCLETKDGMIEALSVIIASGACSKKLQVPGEKEFLSKGVSYCATCDGAFFRDKNIIVVGGGDTAVEEALFLTRFGKKVTIIHRRDRLRAVKILQERAAANKKISFIWDSVVEGIEGTAKVEKVNVRNVKTDEKQEVPCDGVFVFVGWEPNTGFSANTVEFNSHGAIIVNNEMKTSADGIFAAGDCSAKLLHQIVTACGDGATAAFSAQKYVEELKGVAY